MNVHASEQGYDDNSSAHDHSASGLSASARERGTRDTRSTDRTRRLRAKHMLREPKFIR